MRRCVLLVLLAACGSSGGDHAADAAIDSPSTDAIADAPADAGVPGLVSFIAVDRKGGRAGIPVIFQNADSSVVSSVTTGADGKASAMMVAGGYVTAISPFITEGQLHTFADVKPGDVLRDYIEDLEDMSVTVTVPVPTGTTYLDISTTCERIRGGRTLVDNPSPPSVTATVDIDRCSGMADVLVTRGPDGATLYKANVAIAPNATIDLTGESFVAQKDFAWSVPNFTGTKAVFDVRNVTPNGIVGNNNTIVFDPTLQVPGIAEPLLIDTLLTNASVGRQRVKEWGVTSPYSLDTNAVLLPTWTIRPRLDATQTKLIWTLSATGQTPDFVVIQQQFSRGIVWAWRISLPYSATNEVTLPVMPAPYTKFNPTGSSDLTATAVLYKYPGGYDAARGNAVSDDFDHDVPYSASGVILTSEYTN